MGGKYSVCLVKFVLRFKIYILAKFLPHIYEYMIFDHQNYTTMPLSLFRLINYICP